MCQSIFDYVASFMNNQTEKTIALMSLCTALILFLSCNKSKHKHSEPPVVPAFQTKIIKGVNNDSTLVLDVNVIKSYILQEKKMKQVKCVLHNNAPNTVYYVNQTCNALEYYLIFEPNSEVWPYMVCNASFPIISSIAPYDSIVFMTQIQTPGNTKIGLDFRQTNVFIPFDRLQKQPELIEDIFRSKTNTSNIIWSSGILK
ncbi:MAG: hypothetical protein ACI9JN_002321 [Bacteroidia bacterium]|jgi:hypothetical protein